MNLYLLNLNKLGRFQALLPVQGDYLDFQRSAIQSTVPSRLFNHVMRHIFIVLLILISHKRDSRNCVARLEETMWAPRLILINCKVHNISKYVCFTVLINITKKSPNFSVCVYT